MLLLRVSLPLLATLAMGTGVCAAQQLPPGPGPIPELRRGSEGQLEVVTPLPEAKVKTPATDLTLPAPLRADRRAKPEASRPITSPAQVRPAPAPTITAPVPVPPAIEAVVPTPTPVAKSKAPAAATIDLPEPLAIELPAGTTTLAPDAEPLRSLLASVTSGGRIVTDDLDHPVGPGPVRVTWIAWDGAAGTGKRAAVASAFLFVLPPGVAPVGLSGDENATAGNNSGKIARNARGDIVHMVWLDGGRVGKGTAVLYRRATIAADGSITWAGPPERIDEAASEAWNSFPGLAVAGNTVHVAWQAKGHAWYRRLDQAGGDFRWSAARELDVASVADDVGPSVAALGELIHIATPSGFDIVSTDGGASWRADPIPLPLGRKAKTISVALDPTGAAHFAISAVVHGPQAASTERASHGYWELLYLRRDRDGTWSNAENVLRVRPEWGEPGNDDDVLADWVRILADDARNLHLTWHGTARARIYGNDDAYYVFRAADNGWGEPQLLVPDDPAQGIKHSFAPTLALDGEMALPLAFYGVLNGTGWSGFDSVARVARHGKLSGAPIPVAQWIRGSINAHRQEAALSTRFPSVSPRPYHAPDGRIWLDVLQTLIPMGLPDAPNLIAYQRIDLSPWLGRSELSDHGQVAVPGPMSFSAASAAPPPADDTVLFTLGDVLAFIPNLISRLGH